MFICYKCKSSNGTKPIFIGGHLIYLCPVCALKASNIQAEALIEYLNIKDNK